MSLILKKDKEAVVSTSYRPIGYKNYDRKISMLADWLNKALSSIIHPD